MKKSVVLLVVSAIILIVAALYIKNGQKNSAAAADAASTVDMYQQDILPGSVDRQDAVESQPEQRIEPVNPSVGSKQIDLPFEKNLLEGTSLSVAKIQSLLQSKQFEIQLDKFASESAADSSASELTSTYRGLLAQQFETHKVQANLVKLVCGVETCIGLIRDGTDAEYSRWADVFFQDPATPNYGFANISVKQPDGSLGHRFVFSIDPAINSASAPRQ